MNIHGTRLIITLLSALPLAAVTRSAEPAMPRRSTATFSVAEAVAVALRENPEIAAAHSRARAVRARVAQAWTPESPVLEVERMYAPREENPFSGATERSVAVSQGLPFPTALYYRGRAARREAEMADARMLAKEREVISRVKNAYAMLYLSHHSIHIFEASVALMRQFAGVAQSKYTVGKRSQGDVLKAQVELSRMRNMLVTLEQEEATSRAMLNTLLNREPDAPLGMPEDLSPGALKADLEALTRSAVERRPELREALSAVERAGAMTGAAYSEFLPELMLQYRRREMDDGMRTHDAVVGLSLPLWFWRQGAMVSEARAERRMAEAEATAMRNMTRFDVKNLFVKVQTAARLVELYRVSVIPQAEQTLKVTEAAYQSDKVGFLDLLDAARSLLEFRLEHYQHIAEYLMLKADLERVIGGDIQ